MDTLTHTTFMDIVCGADWVCKQATISWRIVVIRTDCVRYVCTNESFSHFSFAYLSIFRSFSGQADEREKTTLAIHLYCFIASGIGHCQIRFCPRVCCFCWLKCRLEWFHSAIKHNNKCGLFSCVRLECEHMCERKGNSRAKAHKSHISFRTVATMLSSNGQCLHIIIKLFGFKSIQWTEWSWSHFALALFAIVSALISYKLCVCVCAIVCNRVYVFQLRCDFDLA